MMSAINSETETPPVASGKLSYSMNSPRFLHLLKWLSKSREDPDAKATLIKLRPCFSSNVQRIFLESTAPSERMKDEISKEQKKTLALIIQPSCSESDGLLSILSDKIANKKETFADIECLEFGVNLKTANDRVSLLSQMIRDISSHLSGGLKFTKKSQLVPYPHFRDNSSLLHLFEEIILQSLGVNEKCSIKFSIPTSAVLHSLLFVEILKECKIEAAFEVQEDPSLGVKSFARTFTGKEVPMLVFSTADFDAATDACINAAWFSEGLVSWATTAVLIHESIYHKFTTHFKSRLQKSAENVSVLCSKPNIEEDVEVNVQKVLSEAKRRDLEVFQVFPSKGRDTPATLIIGDFVTSHLTSFSNRRDYTPLTLPILFVVPFRTVSEGISLANESSGKVAVSVWSESLSLCLSSTSSLNFGTIWVNSFGIFDARIPVFSYGNVSKPVCATGLDYIRWTVKSRGARNDVELPSADQDDNLSVEKLLSSAHDAHLLWNNRDVQSKIEIMDKIWNSSIESSSLTTDLRLKLIEAVRSSFDHSFSLKVKNCLVSSSVTPVGVIIFIAGDENSSVKDSLFLESILTAIFSGNAVIVITQLFVALLSALKLCLPEHLLSILPQKIHAIDLLNLLKKHKLGAEKVRNWTLLPSESANSILVETSSEESCQIYDAPNIVEYSTKRKVIWLPVA